MGAGLGVSRYMDLFGYIALGGCQKVLSSKGREHSKKGEREVSLNWLRVHSILPSAIEYNVLYSRTESILGRKNRSRT